MLNFDDYANALLPKECERPHSEGIKSSMRTSEEAQDRKSLAEIFVVQRESSSSDLLAKGLGQLS